jgi:hypothetical protein
MGEGVPGKLLDPMSRADKGKLPYKEFSLIPRLNYAPFPTLFSTILNRDLESQSSNLSGADLILYPRFLKFEVGKPPFKKCSR